MDSPTTLQPAHLQDIEMLSAEFEALGMTDPAQVVSNWLGKHDDKGHVINSVNEVLVYMQAQIRAMQRSSAETAAADEDLPDPVYAVDDTPRPVAPVTVVTAAPTDHKARLAMWREADEAAGKAWRDAVAQRKAAIAQWDAYVEHARRAFQHIRSTRPMR